MDDRAARTADYVRAQVRLPTLGLVLRPREPGVTVGAFPFDDVVHLITAYNPGAVRPGPTENAARQECLVSELERRGLPLYPAEAGAADGAHSEASVLVEGLSDDAARGYGAAWGQDAVFRWSRSAWTVLACDDAPSVDLGWEIEGGPVTEIFGPYELTEMLGRGGMGEVWRAVDTRKARTVALKRLPSEMTGEREFEERFRREAHAAARLNDPHVIPIHDFGEIDGRLFLDMRLVQGDDLGAVVARHGALPPTRVVSVIEQVASALDAAHDERLVHRDVKPSNILLTPSKRTVGPQDFVYLIDFGIATGAALGTRLTRTGMAIGTAAYMAPERFADGVDTDPRIDVYALGCVLHEMLTGRRPFAGRDFASLMYQHLNTTPPAPSRAVASLPAAFDEVVAQALTKDRGARFARAGDLAAAARAALSPPSASQRRTPTVVPSRPASPVDRTATRAEPVDRPAARSRHPVVPVRWSPVPPVRTGPPRAPGVVTPPAAGRSDGARLAAAILVLPALLFMALLCLVATSETFSACATRSLACVGGFTGALSTGVTVVGIGLAIAAMTAVGRTRGRRAGRAWAMLGASIPLLFLTAAFAVV